ncbi:MAG: family 10 glycosylhydrolase [Myxococcales bacterium]|nr:family 10 glycosylhydrolase [Myxococcales bacterium]
MRWGLLVLGLVLGCAEGEAELDRPPVADAGDVDADRRDDDAAPRPPDAGAPDARPERDAAADAEVADARSPDAGPPADAGPGGVVRQHDRELRGVWIATVFNINFPSRAGLSVEAQRAELAHLLDVAADAHLNTVFFQVRAEGDAFYRSDLEPASRFLTGRQGMDPGWDPLAEAIEGAHDRGLELHAWLNPYRAAASMGLDHPPTHMARRFPAHAHPYDTGVWMDPGAPEVQAHTVAVIRDLVTRYDLDGVHFDDYFYPYPDGTPFPDDATWADYQAGGGALARDDWRRDNVNRLVAAVAAAIRDVDPDVRFGISPFGIYRPGIPAGIVGLDQYGSIFADPVHWLQAGDVDYLAPQLYWNGTRPQQDYETLLRWWTSLVADGRQIYVGNYLAQLGSAAAWDVAEFERELDISRALRPAGSLGNIFFHIAPLAENRDGITDTLRARYYPHPAVTPPLAGRGDEAVAPPRVEVEGSALRFVDAGRVRGHVIYGEDGAVHQVVRRSGATVPAGTWHVTTVGRQGAESLAVPVTVRP